MYQQSRTQQILFQDVVTSTKLGSQSGSDLKDEEESWPKNAHLDLDEEVLRHEAR